jgi:hypothetical protein
VGGGSQREIRENDQRERSERDQKEIRELGRGAVCQSAVCVLHCAPRRVHLCTRVVCTGAVRVRGSRADEVLRPGSPWTGQRGRVGLTDCVENARAFGTMWNSRGLYVLKVTDAALHAERHFVEIWPLKYQTKGMKCAEGGNLKARC